MNIPTLPDIRLRALEPEDIDLVYEMDNDATIWDLGATNVPYSRFSLTQYIANTTNDIYADRQVRLVIEDAQQQMVGLLDIMQFDPQHNRAELGIVIKKDFRGKGIATAALKKALQYAKAIFHLHQLYVVVAENNLPSMALFQHAGFSQTARLPQWLYDGENYHDACFMQFFL